MSLPAIDTIVTYPDGDLVSEGTVVGVTALADGRSAVLLDRTAFHALDPVWPDQPADRGTLTAGGVERPIVDAVVGATDGSQLFVGDAPVRTGTEGWTFVVCHLVEDAAGVSVGAPASVAVDAAYRRALSAGHTACHLASLALNDALAGLWTKDVPGDGRGRPDFDRLAITSSRIVEHGSVDEYRIGKSLRKKGFAAADLSSRLAEVQDAVNADLADWLTTEAPVSIARDGEGLSERRFWHCELPEGTVEIACGGTHLTSLAELEAVTVELALAEGEGALELRMETTARLRQEVRTPPAVI